MKNRILVRLIPSLGSTMGSLRRAVALRRERRRRMGRSGSDPRACLEQLEPRVLLSAALGSSAQGLPPSAAPGVIVMAAVAPVIKSVTATPVIVSGQSYFNWQFTISGTGMGTQAPFDGTTPSITVQDATAPAWAAGGSGDPVALKVTDWSNTQVSIAGYAANYGTNSWVANPGDSIQVTVRNPASGVSSDTYLFTLPAEALSGPAILAVTNSGPVNEGGRLTFTASGVTAPAPATVKTVDFYNASTNKLLGPGKLIDGNYVLTTATTTLAVGPAYFYAIATDSARKSGPAIAFTATILGTPPTIARLAATKHIVAAGNTITLKAVDVGNKYDTTTGVTFYWDPTGTGTTVGAVVLGTATAKTGWKLTTTTPSATGASPGAPGFPSSGTATFVAQATNSAGTLGNLATVAVNAVAQPVIAQFTILQGGFDLAPGDYLDPSHVMTFTAGGVTDSTTRIVSVKFWLAPAGATSLVPGDDNFIGRANKLADGDWAHVSSNLDIILDYSIFGYTGYGPPPPGDYVIFALAMDAKGMRSVLVPMEVRVG